MTDLIHLNLRKNQSRRRIKRTDADNDLTKDLNDCCKFLMSFTAEERKLLIHFIESNVKHGGTPIPQSSNLLYFPPPQQKNLENNQAT